MMFSRWDYAKLYRGSVLLFLFGTAAGVIAAAFLLVSIWQGSSLVPFGVSAYGMIGMIYLSGAMSSEISRRCVDRITDLLLDRGPQ